MVNIFCRQLFILLCSQQPQRLCGINRPLQLPRLLPTSQCFFFFCSERRPCILLTKFYRYASSPFLLYVPGDVLSPPPPEMHIFLKAIQFSVASKLPKIFIPSIYATTLFYFKPHCMRYFFPRASNPATCIQTFLSKSNLLL